MKLTETRKILTYWIIGGVLAGAALLWLVISRVGHEDPSTHTPSERDIALAQLEVLLVRLERTDQEAVGKLFMLPPGIANRSASEREHFLRSALNGELSREGLQYMAENATFGSLTDFPEYEPPRWLANTPDGIELDELRLFYLENAESTSEALFRFHQDEKFETPLIIRVDNIHHSHFNPNDFLTQ